MEREIQLQHDIHNSLDRVSNQLYILDKWNEEMSLHKKDPVNNPLPNLTVSYVVAEYLRTHIKDMRDTINQYYQDGKEVKP